MFVFLDAGLFVMSIYAPSHKADFARMGIAACRSRLLLLIARHQFVNAFVNVAANIMSFQTYKFFHI